MEITDLPTLFQIATAQESNGQHLEMLDTIVETQQGELEKLKLSSNYQVSRIVAGHNNFSVLVDRLGEDACQQLSNISVANNSYRNTD